MNAVAGVVAFIGLASFGALAWVARSLAERPFDFGAVMVVAVLATFGLFCLYIAWRLGAVKEVLPTAAAADAVGPGQRRITLSHLCSTAGVLLMMAAVVLPEHWYPAVALFAGIALLCAAHVLTPCVERLEKLRRARESTRQL